MNVTILYSGGLDSFIMHQYAIKQGYKPILVYVDLGHPYSTKEKKTFRGKDVKIVKLPIYQKIKHRITNQIIPSRNLLLAVIGGMFSERVWLGALDGEQLGKERDKSEKFFKDTTDLLTYLNNFFQQETIVETPFKNMSKMETIKWALENGISADELLKTKSCYSSSDEDCGECLTCVKRHMAFKLNGIEDGNKKKVHNSKYFAELFVDMAIANKNNDYKRFTKKRIKEFNDYILCRNRERR